jgi:allantoinase
MAMTGGAGWPNGARLAMSFIVNVEEGSEMNPVEGDRSPEAVDELGVVLRKPVRNFGNESNYQYGIRAGAPRVMALLTRYGVTATFAAAALSLERAPELARQIVEDGHEVCSHGWRWIHQFHLSEEEERAFIRKAVRSIERTTGRRPRGWLSRYLLTPNTRRLLIEEGFTYHMDDYSDDLPFWDFVDDKVDDKPILIVPYALDSNDMKMWTTPALTPADWLRYAVDSFDWLYAEAANEPRMMSLGVHLRIISRPGRIAYLERFIQHVRRHERVWIATREAIADHWAAEHPPTSGSARR